MDLDIITLALLAGAFFAAAALYSSVGHGGASAYLAIMALFSLPPEVMRPTALMLNILAASLGALRFLRAGRFAGDLFWPIALGAAPFAFLGGAIRLPEAFYSLLLGLVLLAAALRLAWPGVTPPSREPAPPPALALGATGAGIGMLAGLTGTGGGIFLSPLLILANWARAENTTGIAACFIVLNSAAGLAGNVSALGALPAYLPWLAGAVGLGAIVGGWLGVARYTALTLRRALALVMLAAAAKLLLT